MDRSIELLRYRQFGSDLFLFELVNAVSSGSVKGTKASANKTSKVVNKGNKDSGEDQTAADWLDNYPSATRELFKSLESYILFFRRRHSA